MHDLARHFDLPLDVLLDVVGLCAMLFAVHCLHDALAGPLDSVEDVVRGERCTIPEGSLGPRGPWGPFAGR